MACAFCRKNCALGMEDLAQSHWPLATDLWWKNTSPDQGTVFSLSRDHLKNTSTLSHETKKYKKYISKHCEYRKKYLGFLKIQWAEVLRHRPRSGPGPGNRMWGPRRLEIRITGDGGKAHHLRDWSHSWDNSQNISLNEGSKVID